MKKSENHKIEYKESWRDEYLKWICGFANSNGGKLYIGMNDKGEVIGIKNTKKLLEDIPNKIMSSMGIVCKISVKTKHKIEYIEIVVKKSTEPVFYHGGMYIRSGATNQRLTGSELKAYLVRDTGYDFCSEVVDDVKIKDLDKESFDIFRREAIKNNRMKKEELNISNKELLNKLNLIKNGKLTRAAVMLFYRNPEKYFKGCHVRIGLFEGSELIYDDDVKGSLIIIADRVIDIIYVKYLKKKITYDHLTRVETYQYPIEAVREAIYNALIHSDYSNPNDIQIKVMDDELFIGNNCLIDTSKINDKSILTINKSIPLNPLLADTFYRAGFIEHWGRGIKRICDECKANGMKIPRFEIVSTDFAVIFKANYKYDYGNLDDQGSTTQKTTQKTTQIKSVVAKRILDVIDENKDVTLQELADSLGKTRDGIKYHINKLQNLGILKRVGPDKGGYWEIVE